MPLAIFHVLYLSLASWAIRVNRRTQHLQGQAEPLLDAIQRWVLGTDNDTDVPLVPITWRTATSSCGSCQHEHFSAASRPPCSEVDSTPVDITKQLEKGGTADITLESIQYTCCCRAHFQNSTRQVLCNLEAGSQCGMNTMRWNNQQLRNRTTWRDIWRALNAVSEAFLAAQGGLDVEEEGVSDGSVEDTDTCKVPAFKLHILRFPDFAQDTSSCHTCLEDGFDPQATPPCSKLLHVGQYYRALLDGNKADADRLKDSAVHDLVPAKYMDAAWLEASKERVDVVRSQVRKKRRERNDPAGFCLSFGPTNIHLSRPKQDSDPTIFEQTFATVSNAKHCSFGRVSFGREEAVDLGGPKVEWLASVLNSATRPAGEITNAGLGTLGRGTRSRMPFSVFMEFFQEKPKFLLEEKGAYDIPVWSNLNTSTTKDGTLGHAGEARFRFLGQWLALAHVLDVKGVLCPRNLHPLMYDSIADAAVVKPSIDSTYYQKEHQIPECEWLAILRGGYDDLKTYAPLPGHPPPARPYYAASLDFWELLSVEYGPDAPRGITAETSVPHKDAKAYTQRLCSRVWTERFAAPMNEIILGFYDVIPRGELGGADLHSTPASLTGDQLKLLVEGLPIPLTIDRILQNAVWRGWLSDEKEVFIRALERLNANEVKKLLIFMTGNSREPLGGFIGENTPKFMRVKKGKDSGKCPLVLAHTCFSTLDVPHACLNEADLSNFVDRLKFAIEHLAYGFA